MPFIQTAQQFELGAHYLDGEGMDAAFELGVERFHDGTMLGYPAAGELRRSDTDTEMRLSALSITAVTPMFFALIEHFKMARREFDRKFFNNVVANGHMHTGSV